MEAIIRLGTGGMNKPFSISGKMMMIAMHDIYEFLCPFAFCHPMKNKTMHDVFKKGPE